MMDARNTPPCM